MDRKREFFLIVSNDAAGSGALDVVLRHRGHVSAIVRNGFEIAGTEVLPGSHFLLDWRWDELRNFFGAAGTHKLSPVGRAILLVYPDERETDRKNVTDLSRLPRVSFHSDDPEVTVDEIETFLGMRGRVLLVDDDEDVREMCTEILSDYYEVDAVPNPIEAIKKLEAGAASYTAIVTDVMMPVMSGIEFMDFVANEFPELPVVVITGYPSQELIRKSNLVKVKLRGGLRLLTKPFSIDQLLAATKGVPLREQIVAPA